MGPRHTDITTKKFTFTLPTLFAVISACSVVIGGYWWAKTTIANLQQSVDIANGQYADVKSEVKLLREQMYEIAFLYNRNVANENELTHIRKERGLMDSIVAVPGMDKNSVLRRVNTVPIGAKPNVNGFIPKRDTIDLSNFRRSIR